MIVPKKRRIGKKKVRIGNMPTRAFFTELFSATRFTYIVFDKKNLRSAPYVLVALLCKNFFED